MHVCGRAYIHVRVYTECVHCYGYVCAIVFARVWLRRSFSPSARGVHRGAYVSVKNCTEAVVTISSPEVHRRAQHRPRIGSSATEDYHGLESTIIEAP